jgi:hypothetical protein
MEKGSPAGISRQFGVKQRRLRTPIERIKRSADAVLVGYAPGETLQFATAARFDAPPIISEAEA